MPPLAIAAIIAAVAGVAGSAGLLGQRPHAPAARGSLTAQVDAVSAGPPARAFAAAGYDPARGETVLFGGRAGENRLLDDTWTWDGSAWQRHHPARAPSPRKAAAMAWDRGSGRLLLFGGEGPVAPGQPDSALRDSWAWDGSAWTPLATAAAPPARLGSGTAALATDATTGEVLLVGDGGRQGTACSLATWHWERGAWSELHPATAPRSALTGRLAYAPGTGGLVLVTALPTASACGGVARDAAVWTWNGATWTEQHPVTALAAKHVVDGQLGGSVAGVMIPGYHTFTWDGSDWHDGGPDGPGALRGGGRLRRAPPPERALRRLLHHRRPRPGRLRRHLDLGRRHLAAPRRRPSRRGRRDGGGPRLALGAQPAAARQRRRAHRRRRLRLRRRRASAPGRLRPRPRPGGAHRPGQRGGHHRRPLPRRRLAALAGGVLWLGAGVHPGVDNPGGLALYGLDPSTLDVRHELALDPPAGVEQFSARLVGLGDRLWLGWGGELIGIDPRTGTPGRHVPLPAGQSLDDLALDPTGGRLYSSARLPTGDALISVRDPATGVVRASATEHSTAGARLAAGADGVWISFPTGLSSELHHRGAADLRRSAPRRC